MSVNVLYLSYDGMTDPLGQAQVLPYLMGLSKQGFSISLISFEKKERLAAGKEVIENLCQAAGIKWYPQKYTKKPPILSTAKDVRKMLLITKKLHKQNNFSLLHCRSYITSLVGLMMKKKYNIPFVFDMRGFWADERIDGGLWKLSNPLFKLVYTFFKKKEKEFLNSAAAVISLTHNAKAEILSWPSISASLNISVIPCCVDLDLFDPAKINQTNIKNKKAELTIEDGANILSYIGSIGTWYMLKEMLDFFKVWQQNYVNSIFLIVTPDDKTSILEAAKKAGITETKIRIVQGKRTEMPLYVKLSNYSIFFIKDAYSKKASSPTKQGEIMAMGIPAICNGGVGDTDYVVEQFGSGQIIKTFNEKAYQECITLIKNQSYDSKHIRQGAEEFYSLQEGIQQYAIVYNKILNAK